MIDVKSGDIALFRWDIDGGFVAPQANNPESIVISCLLLDDKEDEDGMLPCLVKDSEAQLAECGWLVEEEDTIEFKLDAKHLGWYLKFVPKIDLLSKIDTYDAEDFVKLNTRWTSSGGKLSDTIWSIRGPSEQCPDNTLHDYKVIGRSFRRDIWNYQYMVIFDPQKKTAIGWPLDGKHQEAYGFDPKYLGEFGVFIEGEHIVGPGKPFMPLGMSCFNPACREFSPWVDEPNFPNNIFLCYSCRTNPITKSLLVQG